MRQGCDAQNFWPVPEMTISEACSKSDQHCPGSKLLRDHEGGYWRLASSL
jgi:hypothetical protein